MNEKEKERKHFQCVFPVDKQRILLVDPEKYENNILRQNRQHERQFSFDAAFGPNSSQEDVHAATTGPLVDSVVDGYNATVFAYGATGAGKTYTMIGTKERPGLMTLLTKSLYEKINLNECEVLLSYLEVYNEVIRDLLNPASGILELMEDEKGNVRVPGLATVKAPNVNRIMQILQEGNQRRTQEATDANKTSSRSHALLQVSLVKNGSQHGKLFLIDLAGSERAAHTNNRGQRLKEGAAINRSLLALGNVINSLSSNNKPKYVNYRDSKLTRLLKDSLGGNARTCMIAHVTSASGHYEETYNTLVYASRAKNISNRITRNRPHSADQAYNDAKSRIEKELDQRMTHAISSNQIAQMDTGKTTIRWNTNVNPNRITYQNANLSSRRPSENKNTPRQPQFSSLFGQLKDQYLTLSDKQNKLRERLLKANQEAYDVEMSRTSKLAILAAWEKAKEGNAKPTTIDSIDRLQKDVEDLEARLNGLTDNRRKIERALRKGNDTAKSIESRMRALAATPEQREMIELAVKMARIEAEKVSVESDLALQNILIKRTDCSMTKLQKYESVADKLIEGDLNEKDREQLEHEYRIVKNQFHYTLVPLKNVQPPASWNSQLLLPKIPAATTDDLGKTFVVSKKKRGSIQLPSISSHNDSSGVDSNSDSMSETTPSSPSSVHLPKI
ncbi:unnamed protein product, partial [Mesorhabditis spiculigera]